MKFHTSTQIKIVIAIETRWRSARITLQSQSVSIATILLAAVLSWSDFDQSRPATWFFVGGLAVPLVGLLLLFLFMEKKLANTLTAQ